jgi:hypothetical protein
MTQVPGRSAFRVMPRDWLLFGAVLLWLPVSLSAIFNVVPGRSAIERASQEGILQWALKMLNGIPYVRRVQENMETHGHPLAEIAAKVQFLATSYFIMLSAYAVAVAGVTLVLIAWGAEGDGYTDFFTVLGKRSLVLYWVLLPFLLIVDLFFAWFGIHGFGYFPEETISKADWIVSNNSYIVVVLFFLSFSLLCSLVIARFTVCYAYARRHAPDIPKQWPLRGVPQMDPAPEIEVWDPEKHDR